MTDGVGLTLEDFKDMKEQYEVLEDKVKELHRETKKQKTKIYELERENMKFYEKLKTIGEHYISIIRSQLDIMEFNSRCNSKVDTTIGDDILGNDEGEATIQIINPYNNSGVPFESWRIEARA
jgi:Mg2+ and Co2+ transporter CorA